MPLNVMRKCHFDRTGLLLLTQSLGYQVSLCRARHREIFTFSSPIADEGLTIRSLWFRFSGILFWHTNTHTHMEEIIFAVTLHGLADSWLRDGVCGFLFSVAATIMKKPQKLSNNERLGCVPSSPHGSWLFLLTRLTFSRIRRHTRSQSPFWHYSRLDRPVVVVVVFLFRLFAALRFFDLLFQFESHSHTASPETIAEGERESSEQRLRRQEFFAVIIFVASQGPRENRRKSEGKCDWNLPQSDDFRSSDKASECFCGCRDFKRFQNILWESFCELFGRRIN